MTEYLDPGSGRRFRVSHGGGRYAAQEGRVGVDKPSVFPITLGHYDTAGEAEGAILAACPTALPVGKAPADEPGDSRDDGGGAAGEPMPGVGALRAVRDK